MVFTAGELVGGEAPVTAEHVKNNLNVRGLLAQEGISPESLPAAEDAKKVARRLGTEPKKIARETKGKK